MRERPACNPMDFSDLPNAPCGNARIDAPKPDR